MVDFRKRLTVKDSGRKIDPIALYDTLDRASDKGPLRPAQLEILGKWHHERRTKRDVIVKLHTGQGKTLIGLLMLQSKLNEGHGPALYLCPNNFLIEQTRAQARQFGIRTIAADPELPDEFLTGQAILVTSVYKLFNGLTKFKLGTRAQDVAVIVMDDAHACVDAIREAFTIRVDTKHKIYGELIRLFEADLRHQGAGTFSEILAGQGDSVLPIPYWAWTDKVDKVNEVVSAHRETDEVKFAWPLLRDILERCECAVSSRSLEIAPYLPPLEQFGTFTRAKQRIFMSATVTDDAFLVRGLRLAPEVIRDPIIYSGEKWSGEKMILIPSLIHGDLDRTSVVAEFAPPKARHFGVVGLVPSFARTADWEKYKARIAATETIQKEVERLKNGEFGTTLVLANRYDGIDLPDNACRVLVFDSKPHAENLIELCHEACRSSSDYTGMRVARSIEQGLGRAVRGEKDYCVILIVGADLVRIVKSAATAAFLSEQTRLQVQIGNDIAQFAQEEPDLKKGPMQVLRDLVEQCVGRDEGWKEYYVEQMSTCPHEQFSKEHLEVFAEELEAEQAYVQFAPADAAKIIQELMDKHVKNDEDRGWYLQELARYTYAFNRAESGRLQVRAHSKNPYVLKPREGMQVRTISAVSERRISRIRDWLKSHGSNQGIFSAAEELLVRIDFGVKAEPFEAAIKELGLALGFGSQRPEKELGEGPDNLWAIKDGEYYLMECKSEVKRGRVEIYESETGQMNNSCAWFKRVYPGASLLPVMIIPATALARGAGFNEPVEIMREGHLRKLVKNVRAFFSALREFDLASISDGKLQELLDAHDLSPDAFKQQYTSPVRYT